MRPDLLYGDHISFEVRRNGSKVGHHVTRFAMKDGALHVTTQMALKVKILFITAYSYSYDAESIWCGRHLLDLDARVDDNGKDKNTRAARVGTELVIDARGQRIIAEGSLLPTDHWDMGILKEKRLLNVLVGKIANVEVTDRGEDMVEVKGGSIPAHHYSYSGDIAVDVWYDRAGRWVKLRFVTKKDQSVIDYICETCIVPEQAGSLEKEAQARP